jgi:hypothetical protein
MVVAYRRNKFDNESQIAGVKNCLKLLSTAPSGNNKYGSFHDKDAAISMEFSLEQTKGFLSVLTGRREEYLAKIVRPGAAVKEFTIKKQSSEVTPYHITMRWNGLYHSISIRPGDAWHFIMVAVRVLKELYPDRPEQFLLETFIKYA